MNLTKKCLKAAFRCLILLIAVEALNRSILPIHCFGQRQEIADSLNRLIRNLPDKDTTRILALTDLAYQYRSSQPDTCISLAREALRASESIKYTKGTGRSENVIGLWNYNLNRYDSASKYFDRAIEHLEVAGDLQGKALALNNQALVLEFQGRFPEALDTYIKAQAILTAIDDAPNQSITLNNIALLLLEINEYTQAIEYLERNIALDSTRGDCEGVYFGYNNLGIAYNRIGQREAAMKYYGRGLAEAEACSSVFGQTMTHANLGDVKLELGMLEAAEIHYDKSLWFAGQLQDADPALYPLAGLAKVAFAEKDYHKAIQYALKGHTSAQALEASNRLAAFSKILYESYKASGDDSKALQYLEQLKIINDSLFNIEKHKSLSEINLRNEITELQRKEALERAEKEAAELQMAIMQVEAASMRQTLWMLGLGVLMLIAAGLYSYRNLRSMRRKNAIIAQQKAEIEELNENLAQKIEERTARLQASNEQLKTYAFHNAHIVRAPLANILALVSLLRLEDDLDTSSEREELTDGLQQAAEELDRALHHIQDVVRDRYGAAE